VDSILLSGWRLLFCRLRRSGRAGGRPPGTDAAADGRRLDAGRRGGVPVPAPAPEAARTGRETLPAGRTLERHPALVR